MRNVIFVLTLKPLTQKLMDDEEILELVKNGDLDPSDIDDFKELDPDIQEMVASGDIAMDDARDLT